METRPDFDMNRKKKHQRGSILLILFMPWNVFTLGI